MTDFLKDYLDKRRATVSAQAEGSETAELLGELNNNIGLVAVNTGDDANTSKKILGTIESQVAIEQQQAAVFSDFTLEQLAAFDEFSDLQRKQTRTLSRRLGQLNKTLSDILGGKLETSDKTLKEIASYLKPDTTHSKRSDDVVGKHPKDIRPEKENTPSAASSLFSSIGDLFSSGDGRKGRKGKGGKKTIGVPASPSAAGRTSSWWDKIKGKTGAAAGGIGEAEAGAAGKTGGLKGLWNKIPRGVKVAGLVGAGMAASSIYDTVTSDDPNVDKPKEVAKTVGSAVGGVGGWSAGAAAGAGLGALGGPAAPVTVPLGALIGGLAGAWGGSSLGEKAGDLGTDAVRGAGDLASDTSTAIHDAFKNSIIPGFNRVTSNFGHFADEFGITAQSMVGNLKKTFDDLGDSLGHGVSSAWNAAKSFARAPIETTKSAAKSVDSATGGWLRKGVDLVRGESKGLEKGRYTEEEQKAIAEARLNGEKFRGGSGLSEDQKTVIGQTAKKYGVDPNAMAAMAHIESGGNAKAVSATGATGMFQLTGGTAKQYGVKNRFDQTENTEAAAKLMRDNASALTKAGIEPTRENLYLAHQQGAGGAIQILNAANGKGQISPEVAKNMGLNYGNMDPKEYLAKNKAKVEEAYKIVTNGKKLGDESTMVAANTPTVGSKPEAKPIQVAKVEPSKGSGSKPAPLPMESKGTGQRPTPLAKANLEDAPKISTLTSVDKISKGSDVRPNQQVSSIENIYKEAERKVDASLPEEISSVRVANADQIGGQQKVQEPIVGAGIKTSNNSNSTVPTLDSIPVQLTDMGLVLLNIGHV